MPCPEETHIFILLLLLGKINPSLLTSFLVFILSCNLCCFICKFFSPIVFSSLFSCHSSKLLEKLISQGGNRDNQKLNRICCWVRPREDTIHSDHSLDLPVIFCPAGGLFWLTGCFVLTHHLQECAAHNWHNIQECSLLPQFIDL